MCCCFQVHFLLEIELGFLIRVGRAIAHLAIIREIIREIVLKMRPFARGDDCICNRGCLGHLFEWLDDAEHQQCAAAAPLGAEMGAVLGADAPAVLSGGGGGGGGSGPLSAFQGLWRQLGVDKELGNALE